MRLVSIVLSLTQMIVEMKLLGFLICLLTAPVLMAQKPLEFGAFGGAINYQGDLAEDEIEFSETQLAYGIYLNYQAHNFVDIKATVLKGKLRGDDANSPQLAFRQFSFEADLFETNLQLQVHPFGKAYNTLQGRENRFISPYIYLGIGMALADAQLNYQNAPQEVIKEPFPEEFDSSIFLIAPVGAGLRFGRLGPVALSADLGWRSTFSDYLDGVSQNGRPDRRDWYIVGGLHLSYILVQPETCGKF